MTDTVTVGTFFQCSWGYDQTNVDFYKVVGVSPSGKTVQVQLWAARADLSGRVVPGDRPASFPKWVDGERVGEVEAPVQSKRLRFWSDRPSFTVNSYSAAYLWSGRAAYLWSGRAAYLWSGRAAYQTPVGAGH